MFCIMDLRVFVCSKVTEIKAIKGRQALCKTIKMIVENIFLLDVFHNSRTCPRSTHVWENIFNVCMYVPESVQS